MAGRKRHRKIRSNCHWCGRNHSKSKHRFHGYGSYKRTH